jgi:hypothetical protein
MQGDPRLQEILDLLVGCAFGSGEKRSLYPRKGFVELVVRENAFNPLFPQPAQSTYAKDETIFVAFNQLLTLKVSRRCAPSIRSRRKEARKEGILSSIWRLS